MSEAAPKETQQQPAQPPAAGDDNPNRKEAKYRVERNDALKKLSETQTRLAELEKKAADEQGREQKTVSISKSHLSSIRRCSLEA